MVLSIFSCSYCSFVHILFLPRYKSARKQSLRPQLPCEGCSIPALSNMVANNHGHSECDLSKIKYVVNVNSAPEFDNVVQIKKQTSQARRNSLVVNVFILPAPESHMGAG